MAKDNYRPFQGLTLEDIRKRIKEHEDKEEFEKCAMLKKELNRRLKLKAV